MVVSGVQQQVRAFPEQCGGPLVSVIEGVRRLGLVPERLLRRRLVAQLAVLFRVELAAGAEGPPHGPEHLVLLGDATLGPRLNDVGQPQSKPLGDWG